MMSIVTTVTLQEVGAPELDAATHERMEAATCRPGWPGGQLVMPVDRHHQRTTIGTWGTRAHWEPWRNDEAFLETRVGPEGLEAAPSHTRWYEVLVAPRT
jgi:heme-degrading monooxygenase HmoA